ncbi:hypothetical protein K438DRAFT_225168 [Mycena galopus ATCC 62051]|nr:hypothetical protein K438DRAFT_225168 [Mycena galopus ATCC 62051]
MALCLSRTYSCVNIMSDDRLRAREDARKEGVATEDAFDHYFNNARPAALSWKELHLLRDQNDFEVHKGIPTITPLGFALLTCHLGVGQMPDHLAALHDSHDQLDPLNWEVVHRLLHEIMLKYPHSTCLVIDYSELSVSTPILFRVIPYSTNYIFSWDDPLTNFWNHIWSEINVVLGIVDRLYCACAPLKVPLTPSIPTAIFSKVYICSCLAHVASGTLWQSRMIYQEYLKQGHCMGQLPNHLQSSSGRKSIAAIALS